MKEETPKCKDCGQPMFKVGGIGKMMDLDLGEKEYVLVDGDNKEYGKHTQREFSRREIVLYQCPEDKTIVIQ